MSLPTSRPRTYTMGMPGIPDDINELFDAIIGAKYASRWRWFHPSAPNVPTSIVMNEGELVYSAGGQFAGMPIGGWNEGDRITGFAVRHLGTGGSWTATYLLRQSLGGVITTLGTLTIVNPPASWATYQVLGLSATIPANASVYLSETGAALNGNKLGPIGVQSDRL